MLSHLLTILTIIGYIGIFLFGLKLMSESLQKVAGAKLRSLISSMTSNKLAGIFSGLFITALIQSSSATTVMVVSFVNAGLLSLAQAFSVIMGANIGTTLTAWIIALVSFRTDIAVLAFPLLALAIPFVFSKHNNRRSYGELIFGIAFFFLAVNGMKQCIPDLFLHPNDEVLQLVSQFTGAGAIFLSIVVGFLITVLFRSSSASIALAIIACANGWISIPVGAAITIGSNLGSSLTVNWAALEGNISAKRAAFSHLAFNLIGFVWIILLFYPFLSLVEGLISGWSLDPSSTAAFTLALFHTLYNVVNVLLLCWFSDKIVALVTRLIRSKNGESDDEEEFHLNYISTGLLSTSELSILQARREIELYCKRTLRMFAQVRELYHEKEEVEIARKFARIQKYENISDRMEVEIANYLAKISEGRLSDDGKRRMQTNLRIVSELENMADSCYNLARTINRKHEMQVLFSNETNSNVELMFNLVENAISRIPHALSADELAIEDINRSQTIEKEINVYRDQLKEQNVLDVNAGKYPYIVSSIYIDIVSECEQLADFIINVVEAVADYRFYQQTR